MSEECHEKFKQSVFIIVDGVYVFSYEENKVPKRVSKTFPHNLMMAYYAVLAKTPGVHPSGFVSVFESYFNLPGSRTSRRSSVISKIPFVRTTVCYPRTMMPIRLSKKRTNLLAELINVYSP